MFNCSCVFEFVGGKDGESIAFLLGATGSAEAVDVVLRIFGHSVIDDVGDARNVEAAGGDICCDNDIEAAVAKPLESFSTITLLDVGLQCGGLGAFDFLDSD